MHIEDNSKYLLYIEPNVKEKLKEPINDELTKLLEMAISKAKKGTSRYSKFDDIESFFNIGDRYRGIHYTKCGAASSNYDFLLQNGMITNSLAPFYVSWYRNSIPESEMKKLLQLQTFYNIYD